MASNNIQKTKLNRDSFLKLLDSNESILIFKFTATWCGPCKNISPYIEKLVSVLNKNIKVFEIDIDESFDLFAFLRSKKMVKGVPCLLSYNKGNVSFAPDHSISGVNKEEIDAFFMLQVIKNLSS